MTHPTDLLAKNDEGLLPCHGCGKKPFVGYGKKGSCQLHGEPFQAVKVFCTNRYCPTKLSIEAGDVYNGGEPKARQEAIAIWNKTQYDTPIATALRSALDTIEKMAKALEAWKNHPDAFVGNIMAYGATGYKTLEALALAAPFRGKHAQKE